MRQSNGIPGSSPLPFLLCALCAFVVNFPAAGWTTYRGNPARAGNTDGKPGPDRPKVLWVFRSTEHFIASPVPAGDRLYISGLGAFNVPTLYALHLDAKGDKQVAWSRTQPLLKQPTVSSPAIAGGKIIFGDGMHQNDGSYLHVWSTDGESLLWQLPVPGKLVHLEGSPTVVGTRAFVGGGNAGVLCVDLDRATLDGKELPLPRIAAEIEAQWKTLLKKYEEDRKKDPDFAVKPTRDKLPKPAPVKLWQTGVDKWHVDAPVTVVGDQVLACSAFLDLEKVGDRALHSLDAKTGKPNWRAPLKLNPWGGASVLGNVVVVSGSTVGYYPNELKNARGELAAFDLAGKPKWPGKSVKGGVVSCAALADGLAIVTATDGKVRAYDLETGTNRWIYPSGPAGAPFFAPVAVAGGVAYAGDLAGVVHAINLADGKAKWTLDLANDPAVKAPGMIYGGPIVHGGRVYVATCNNEGANAGKPTVVVCIGQ